MRSPTCASESMPSRWPRTPAISTRCTGASSAATRSAVCCMSAGWKIRSSGSWMIRVGASIRARASARIGQASAPPRSIKELRANVGGDVVLLEMASARARDRLGERATTPRWPSIALSARTAAANCDGRHATAIEPSTCERTRAHRARGPSWTKPAPHRDAPGGLTAAPRQGPAEIRLWPGVATPCKGGVPINWNGTPADLRVPGRRGRRGQRATACHEDARLSPRSPAADHDDTARILWD